MQKLNQFELPLYNIKYKKTSNCTIAIYESNRRIKILEFEYNFLEKQQFQASDFFNCLCELRLVLEKHGYLILCNGARVDCYPSGMAREMGRGLKVYQLKLGQIANRNDLFKTFDIAQFSQVGTVEEQRLYLQCWQKNIRKD